VYQGHFQKVGATLTKKTSRPPAPPKIQAASGSKGPRLNGHQQEEVSCSIKVADYKQKKRTVTFDHLGENTPRMCAQERGDVI